MAKRKCRCCGSFTECNDIRLCPSCVDDICPTADPRIEMHCEHSVHVRERIAELDAKANELERERDEARAEALRILRLCADRPNLDHIPFQPARLADWFNRIDNADADGSLAMERAEKAVRERDDARACIQAALRQLSVKDQITSGISASSLLTSVEQILLRTS